MIRSNLNIKPFFLIKVILIYVILCLKSYSDNINPQSNLVVLGSDKAPVKIKIVSSLSDQACHIQNFYANHI